MLITKIVLNVFDLAEAMADLEHSVLFEWTVMLPKWFQTMIVLEKKECIVQCCSVAL